MCQIQPEITFCERSNHDTSDNEHFTKRLADICQNMNFAQLVLAEKLTKCK